MLLRYTFNAVLMNLCKRKLPVSATITNIGKRFITSGTTNYSDNTLVIGRCCASSIDNIAEIQITKMKLDEYLLMYFPENETVFIRNTNNDVKDGDVVLVSELEERVTTLVSHELVKVIYPLGDVTDPVSGLKCSYKSYREYLDKISEAHGYADEAVTFKYEDAEPRGNQEGKKDFTHKKSYTKWHVFEPGHPLHNDPTAV